MYDKVYYFTDGSIKKNINNELGAVAGYIKIDPEGKVSSKAKKVKNTSSIAYVEACAVNMSLEDFIESDYNDNIDCNIYTDSKAVFDDNKKHKKGDSTFNHMMDNVHDNKGKIRSNVNIRKVKGHAESIYDQMKDYEKYNHSKITKEEASFINRGNRDVDQVVTGGQYLCVEFYD